MTADRPRLLLPSVITLTGLAVLIGLGTWQLERKAWKEDLIATLEQRVSAPPADLPPPQAWDTLRPADAEFRRVRLRGVFQDDSAFLYTSGSALRDDVKRPGYFVFSAAELPDGRRVVVNRGYTADRSAPLASGAAEIVGYLRWPEDSSWFVADRDAGANVWHVRNHLRMAEGLGWGSVAPFYIEQESPVPPGGVPHPAALHPNLPNNHLQYALTWYGLAAALLAVFAVWLVRRGRPEDSPAGPGNR